MSTDNSNIIDDNPSDSVEPSSRARRLILLMTIFVVGGCGLFYELITGAVASYLMGDTVVQYSLVIGTFLAAMGLGAFVTQWFHERLLEIFLYVQVLVGFLGGLSSLILFYAFAQHANITIFVVGITGVCGLLVGTEIPLVLRILRDNSTLRVNVAHVFTLDYLGALIASIGFPFLILPHLGLVRSAIFVGMINTAVSAIGCVLFWKTITGKTTLILSSAVGLAILLTLFIVAPSATRWIEDKMYQDEVILAQNSQYQRIVVTRWQNDYRLYLNGHLQFSTADEYRYHESLILPALASTRAKRVLVLGGGDGFALKQILADPQVEHIDLVDIDPAVTEIFSNNPTFRKLNGGSLHDARVHITHQDAMEYLRTRDRSSKLYDVIVMDLPDPSNTQLNKLYSSAFFKMALLRLNEQGTIVTQATSPFYARNAYWCIAHTIAQSEAEIVAKRSGNAVADVSQLRGHLIPYHVHVPSFGDWGFVMYSRNSNRDQITSRLRTNVQFLDGPQFRAACHFPADSARIATGINRLEDPILVKYHNGDWKKWSE